MHQGRCVQIPLVMFGLTHAYFCLYHALSNVVIRRTLTAARAKGAKYPWLYAAFVIFALAYATAMMETLTIMHVRLLFLLAACNNFYSTPGCCHSFPRVMMLMLCFPLYQRHH